MRLGTDADEETLSTLTVCAPTPPRILAPSGGITAHWSIRSVLAGLCLLFLVGCKANPSRGTDTAATSAPAPVPEAKPEPPPPPPPIIIPAGTVLTVSLGQAIGSKTNQTGNRFGGSLAQPIVVGSVVVLPKRTNTSETITEAHAARRSKGGATLNLSLDAIEIQGKPQVIQTSVLQQESKGKGKRTAGLIGGGAGGGALIGGLAGGGNRGAIGALVGAGAGTAGPHSQENGTSTCQRKLP